MKLEQVIASTCRQKILQALSKVKRTHITSLVRMINSTYNEVTRNLEILQNEGIIKITQCGRMKMVELQRDNQKTEKLMRALHALRYDNVPDTKEIEGEKSINGQQPVSDKSTVQ